MSGKFMKKKNIEIFASQIPTFKNPKAQYEQYATPAHVVSLMLWIAYFKYKDIVEQTIVDLGAGTGRIGLTAAKIGAREVFLIDIEFKALVSAKKVAKQHKLASVIHEICGDVTRLPMRRKKFDVVLQNPPFGVHRKGADIIFLEVAMQLADVIYSIHKAETIQYVAKRIKEKKWNIEEIFREKIVLPPTMKFHYKLKHEVKIVGIRASKN